MSKNNRYLDFIAYMQVIGIILVVLGHSFHLFPDGCQGHSTIAYRLIYSFHMPLFLFVAGFLMIYSIEICGKRQKPASFVVSKLRRLILPMIVLTVITFVPRSYMSFAADDTVQLNLRNFLMAFVDSSYMPIPYFWFLHVSFLLLAASFFIIYLFKKLNVKPWITMTVIFCLLLFYAQSSVPASTLFSLTEVKRIGFFFALGALYAFSYKSIDKSLRLDSFPALIVSMALWLGCFFLFEDSSAFYLCSFTGIVMCLSLSKILTKYKVEWLDKLKGANFLIFLLSWYLNVVCQQLLAYYFVLPWWVHSALSLFAGIYVPWLAYLYLEKHKQSRWIKLTRFLLGH